MQTKKFDQYLRNIKKYEEQTIQSRISTCRRIENHFGNIDVHFVKNKCKMIIGEFERANNQFENKKHRIEIDGDEYNGTATLLHSIRLYKEFLEFIDFSKAQLSKFH